MPDYMNAVDYMKAVNELNYNDFPGGGVDGIRPIRRT